MHCEYAAADCDPSEMFLVSTWQLFAIIAYLKHLLLASVSATRPSTFRLSSFDAGAALYGAVGGVAHEESNNPTIIDAKLYAFFSNDNVRMSYHIF